MAYSELFTNNQKPSLDDTNFNTMLETFSFFITESCFHPLHHKNSKKKIIEQTLPNYKLQSYKLPEKPLSKDSSGFLYSCRKAG